jgi:hypothetical protein
MLFILAKHQWRKMFYNIDTTRIKDPATGMMGMEAQTLQTLKNEIWSLEFVKAHSV